MKLLRMAAAVFAVVIAAAGLPATVSADVKDAKQSAGITAENKTAGAGYLCGDSITYSFSNETLTLTGTGEMWNYQCIYGKYAPWLNSSGSNNTIKHIVISEGITSIGNYAFYKCRNLLDVSLPSTLEEIGHGSFNYCSSLSSVSLPQNLEEIDDSAFGNCSSLTSITIPASVEDIGDGAFSPQYLTSITVASGNTEYDSRNNCNAIIETESDSLIIGCANTVIPSDVREIEENAFAFCSTITSITLPASLREIDNYAFTWCTSLTAINIPSLTETIAPNAFFNCTSLTEVSLPLSIRTIGVNAFYNCTAITDVYYAGTEADRNNISVGNGNEYLMNAAWHYAEAPAAPGQPELVGVSVADDGLKLSWNAVDGATSYKVYRKKSGGSWSALKSSVTALSYTDKTAKAGTLYYYTVKAYSSVSHLYGSADSSGKAGIILSTPAKVVTDALADGVQIRWSSVSGATSYKIYRKASGGSWQSLKSGLTTRKFTDKTAVAGTVYYYKIKAYNSKAKVYGEASASAKGFWLDVVEAPVLTAKTGKVYVKWTQVTGADAYAIYRKEAGGSWKVVKRVAKSSGSTRSWTDTSVVAGKTYTYFIRPYKILSGERVYGAYDKTGATVQAK